MVYHCPVKIKLKFEKSRTILPVCLWGLLPLIYFCSLISISWKMEHITHWKVLKSNTIKNLYGVVCFLWLNKYRNRTNYACIPTSLQNCKVDFQVIIINNFDLFPCTNLDHRNASELTNNFMLKSPFHHPTSQKGMVMKKKGNA
jgi:hypothetical protein